MSLKGRVRNTTQAEKIKLFKEVLESLKVEKLDVLSNAELIDLFRKEHGVALREEEITAYGFRAALRDARIYTKQESQKFNTQNILKQTASELLEEGTTELSIRDFHAHTKKYGKISESTVRNHLASIADMDITIKSPVGSQRIDAIEMSDKEIIVLVAKKFVKKGVMKVWPRDFVKNASGTLRPISRDTVVRYAKFLKDMYDIILLGTDKRDKNDSGVHSEIDTIKQWIKNCQETVHIHYVDSVLDEYSIEWSDEFIVAKELTQKIETIWDKYLQKYIMWLAQERINVKNGFTNTDANTLKIDTQKKQFLLLKHANLNINEMSIEEYIKLTYASSSASDKSYGIHMQNLYIGFLLFLHSKEMLVLPFRYLFENCYSRKKVQVEVPFFLSEHPVYLAYNRALLENRLNEKDDKYKRIFLFCLYGLPHSIDIGKIKYEHLAELKNRKESEFGRVKRILNTLGANIIEEVPEVRYNSRYLRYIRQKKFKVLTEHFNKTMNRAYKLGNYSKEKNFYKDWSGEFANFLSFLETVYVNETYSESFLYKVFDYPDENMILTYQEYIEDQELSANTKSKRFTPLIAAFQGGAKFQSLKDIKSKVPIFTDTSIYRSKQTRKPITDYEVLERIEQILRERPPASDYHKKLNIDSSAIAWWPHYDKVVPFEPLILLMHLYIPARGINFRLADRDSFCVTDENGIIKAFHFIHDKNKKRKRPYIAPNIWQDNLDFVKDLIAYNKVHFPFLKRYKYDNQNPDGILPLFPNSDGSACYTEGQHMAYWKKVLLKTQLELAKDGKKTVLIYSMDPDVLLPKTVEEIDTIPQGNLGKYKAVYDLHSLRHTGATKYANAMMPFSLLMLLTGHVDPNVLSNVYVEVDVQAMLHEWENIQRSDVGKSVMESENSGSLREITQKKTKEILSLRDSEKLLEYLEKNAFFSIGGYLGNDELTEKSLEEFAKIDPIFWTPKLCGYCTSSTCPSGLENRCSLCPHFITSIAYASEIAHYVNLQNFRLQKYINMIIMNREKGMAEQNDSLRLSASLELEEMLAWTQILMRANEKVKNKSFDGSAGDDSMLPQTTEGKDIYSVTHPFNADHMLLNLVYDAIDAKMFDNESTMDATEKLVSKLIRYAAKTGEFVAIEDMDNIEVLEWFRPTYERTRDFETNRDSMKYLKDLLETLETGRKSNSLSANNDSKQIEHKGK